MVNKDLVKLTIMKWVKVWEFLKKMICYEMLTNRVISVQIGIYDSVKNVCDRKDFNLQCPEMSLSNFTSG